MVLTDWSKMMKGVERDGSQMSELLLDAWASLILDDFKRYLVLKFKHDIIIIYFFANTFLLHNVQNNSLSINDFTNQISNRYNAN